MSVDLSKVYSSVDAHKKEFIQILREAVAIQSVSADPEKRPEVVRMVEWTKVYLDKTGAKSWLEPLGNQKLPDGSEIPLPPVLLGELGNDPAKKTVLVYGHVDVQPAKKDDGWNTEPFELVETEEFLFARGSNDDKGPVLSWIHAIRTLQEHHIELPVNVKFCFEAMEESGSEGLEDLLKRKKEDGWLDNVEYSCISDSYWLGIDKPCLSYGLRGVCSYHIEITGIRQDLHSGVYGKCVYEPLNDLFYMMSQLTDVKGEILIPGFEKLVAPLTAEEAIMYEKIDFDVEAFKQEVGASTLPVENKAQLLQNRWRNPSLALHGIEGAFAGVGDKTVIPSKVIGKFTIRLVPDMTPEAVDKLVIDYLNGIWEKRGSGNKMRVVVNQGSIPWVGDVSHEHYQAASRAIQKVYNTEPDFIREGCSIPITLTFQELTGKSVILLPTNACDGMAHSQNEKTRIRCYVEGIKLAATYLCELGTIPH